MRLGAYGLQLHGVADAARYLVSAPAPWPELAVEHVADTSSMDHDEVTEHEARFRLSGGAGHVVLSRDPLTLHLHTPERPDDAAIVHPFLATSSAIVSRWLDRDAFHAGAFMTPNDSAWAIVGAKEAGKSSLLAYLAILGMRIVTDDILVIEQGDAFAGPRCIDLREGAARALGAGEELGFVGTRERWRLHTPGSPPRMPLRGVIVPQWSDEFDLVPVPPRLRLTVLFSNLALTREPRDPRRLLDLTRLPFYVLRRPRRWEAMERASSLLLDELPR